MATLHPWKETDTVVGRYNQPEVSVTSWGAPSPSKAVRGNMWQPQPASQAGFLHRPEFSTCSSFLQQEDQQLWPQTASTWLSNVNSTCTETRQSLSQQKAFLLWSQAGLSHPRTCRTGSLQHKSSPGMRAIRERSFGYSAGPISSSLRCLQAWLN